MEYLSTLAKKLKPSETLAVKAEATRLKAQGMRIYDLSCGEPDIDTPEHIKEGAIKALRDGKTKYTEVGGIKELREAIAEKLTHENGIITDPTAVVVCNGGKQALQQLFEVILNPGDEVVIPAPYWVSYIPMVELPGGVPVVVKALPENAFKLTPDQLEQVLTPRTKAVIINSPSNPTGAAYTKSELAALGRVIAAKSTALVVSDEIYEKVTYGAFSFCSCATAMPEMAGRVVTVNGFSKAYSMTGWRVGYLTGPKDIVSAVGRLQSQSTSNVCSIAQYASVAALKGSQDFLAPMIASFERRITSAISIIEQCPSLKVVARPEGAFYLFIRFPDLARSGALEAKSSGALVTHILQKAGVAAVPGEAFGDDAAFRISVAAADSEIQDGVSKLVEVVKSIR
jgi:aspartate aminotransferase